MTTERRAKGIVNKVLISSMRSRNRTRLNLRSTKVKAKDTAEKIDPTKSLIG